MTVEDFSKPAKFEWPPRKVGVDPAAEEASQAAVGDAAPEVEEREFAPSWLHQIERDWLGLIGSPLHAELAAEGWVADGVGAYCPRCGRSVTAFELMPLEDDGEESDEIPQGSRQDCSSCFKRRLPWEQFVRLGKYEGALRDAVLETKFQRSRSTGKELGKLLGRAVAERAKSQKISLERLLIVPVPMHPWRRLMRGIDHTLTISRGMRTVIPGAKIVSLLKRRGLRPTQTEIAPSSRRDNVRKTLLSRGTIQELKAGDVVVLVDDVRTTGSTLVESAQAVKQALKRDAADKAAFVRIWAASVSVTEVRSGEI